MCRLRLQHANTLLPERKRMLDEILEWKSNATIQCLKQYTLIEIAKSTTNNFGFKQALIKASSIRGCISLPTWNGFLELETIIGVLSIQLYKTSSLATLIPYSTMPKACVWNSKVWGVFTKSVTWLNRVYKKKTGRWGVEKKTSNKSSNNKIWEGRCTFNPRSSVLQKGRLFTTTRFIWINME